MELGHLGLATRCMVDLTKRSHPWVAAAIEVEMVRLGKAKVRFSGLLEFLTGGISQVSRKSNACLLFKHQQEMPLVEEMGFGAVMVGDFKMVQCTEPWTAETHGIPTVTMQLKVGSARLQLRIGHAQRFMLLFSEIFAWHVDLCWHLLKRAGSCTNGSRALQGW